MAAIRETLTLEDKFSGAISRYIQAMGQAASGSSAAAAAAGAYGNAQRMAGAEAQSAALAASSLAQTQAQTSESLAQTEFAYGGSAQKAAMYAQQIISTEQNLAQLNMQMALGAQRLTEVSAAQGAASADALAHKAAQEGLIEKTQELQDRLARTRTALDEVAGGSKRAAQMLNGYRAATSNAATGTNLLLGKLRSFLSIYAIIQGVKSLVAMADSMAQTTARLDQMNDGLQTTAELNDLIFQSAQRSRGAYQDTANLVAKLGTLAGNAFSSNAEIVAFAEQINKQMALSGTSVSGMQAAMLQLTQAMSSGVLRGEELNSILEQAPTIAQSIADYLNVDVGTMRDLASEGKITASVVKNAMFAAAEETNAKFESMPMTWAQVWTGIQNTLVQALQPLLGGITWLAQHFEQLAPILVGVAAGAAALAIGLGIQAAATWIATGAAQAFFAALLANPLTYIVLLVGLIVAAIYKWVQSVGGLEVAWLIVVDTILYAWDTVKAGFFTGVYWVADLLDNMGLKFKAVGMNIANFMGDMKVNVLTIIQNMVNGAIDIINWFIDKLNTIPGVSINAIQQQTFAATAAAENEAAKSARAADLAAAQGEVEARIANRADDLANMWAERDANHASRQAEIAGKQAAAAAEAVGNPAGAPEAPPVLEEIAANTGRIARNTQPDTSDEDLKLLEDVAIRRYEARVNTTQLAPSITVQVNGGGDKTVGVNIANTLKVMLAEQLASHTTSSFAEV